jgi:AhpC/TSA family
MRTLLTLPTLALALGLTACTSSGSTSADTTSGSGSGAMTAHETMPHAEAAPKTAELGKPAPDFTLKDLDGKSVSLSDYRGKTVVLEWFNPGCPYVVYAYQDGPLHDMAARCMKDGVVWLTINSGASGMQGAGLDTNRKAYEQFNMASVLLLDETGSVGHLYQARTTPDMFVIDAKGTLVYRGALDNAPRGMLKSGEHVNYVEAALDDLRAGRKVAEADTKSYGCNVKYAN